MPAMQVQDVSLPEPGYPVGNRAWNCEASELAGALGSDIKGGLPTEEAVKRLALDGRNELRGDDSPRPWVLFLNQFKSLVIWVLIGAALLSAALGERSDAIAILTIIILNALIGFYQEFRAERAIAALKGMTAPHARVIRDGHTFIIPAAEVVRGDLLVLEAGDLVAADGRLVSADALRSNEAPLTGESTPVEKGTASLARDGVPLAERRNMVYYGTSIAAGQGRALIVATGMSTEVGHIARLLREAGSQETPLQRRLDRVGRLLLVASLGIVALIFLLGLLRGENPSRMLLTAVSLAVAAIPEGLPAVVTVALALGVGRMVRRNALVRRLPAVETLGCVQVICSDKTGTLTVGQMTVRSAWAGDREYEVTGEGYGTEGTWRQTGGLEDRDAHPALLVALTAAAACNEAELSTADGRPSIVGDPTEGALLVAAAKGNIRREDLELECPRLRVLPFDSERKRMTIVRAAPSGARALTKGAPDLLLARCTHWIAPDSAVRPLSSEERLRISAANGALAGRALRVIGVAFRDFATDEWRSLTDERLEDDLTFAGLLAMYDPPRAEARDAIAACRRAGIRAVMITGDHPATAAAVARELGILSEPEQVASGLDVQGMTDDELRMRIDRIAVYARVTAEDKLRIVRAFRERGMIVAMTGDGVNDAPAVKEASIGVAMGNTGTEVTKEASDMVVTDDNFASIVAAVEEGRGIYDNIKKCLLYLLAGNTAEILIMLVAVVSGWPIPLLPLQILWINLVTDGLPALALATDPIDPEVLHRAPRHPEEQLTDRNFIGQMLLSGTLTAGVGLSAFYYGLAVERDLVAARNYVFTAVVYAELLRSFGVRSPDRPFWTRNLFENTRLVVVIAASIMLQIAIHHTLALQRLFGIGPMSVPTCLQLLVLGAVPLLVLELRKAAQGRFPQSLTCGQTTMEGRDL